MCDQHIRDDDNSQKELEFDRGTVMEWVSVTMRKSLNSYCLTKTSQTLTISVFFYNIRYCINTDLYRFNDDVWITF